MEFFKGYLSLNKVRQYFVNVDKPEFKFPTLLAIYGQLLIHKETVESLKKSFERVNFEVSALHFGLDEEERDEVIKNFTTGISRVLITTITELPRFTNLPQVSLIINFEMSITIESYLYEVGRSYSFGRRFVVINVCDSKEVDQIRDIQNYFHTNIDLVRFIFVKIYIFMLAYEEKKIY